MSTEDMSLFVLLTDVWHYRGGLTRNALHKAQLMSGHLGRPVHVLTVDPMLDFEGSKRAFAEAGLLDHRIIVHNLFEEAGFGGGEATGFFTGACDEALVGQERMCSQGGTQGLSGVRVEESTVPDGSRTLTYVGADGAVRRVERYDGLGRLRVRDELEPDTGAFVSRCHFDPQGRCRFEFRPDVPGGRPWHGHARDAAGRITRTFESRTALGASWLQSHTAGYSDPVLQMETRRVDIVRGFLAVEDERVVKVIVLHTCHLGSPYVYGAPTTEEHSVILKNLDRLDAFVLITPGQKVDVLDEYGPRETVHAVPHDAPIGRDDPQIPREPYLGVGLGRFEAQKNWDHVIRAFASAAEIVPGARFELWGSGPLRGELESLVETLGVTDRFRIRGFSSDPATVLRRAGYSVLAGVPESMSLVLMESMAEATPPIAYDCKYSGPYIVRDDVDGLLVKTGSIDALAGAMVRLMSDPEATREMGRRAQEISERFTRHACIDGWMGVYRSALGQRERRVSLPAGIRCRATSVRGTGAHCRIRGEVAMAAVSVPVRHRIYARPRSSVAGGFYRPLTVDPDGGFTMDFDLTSLCAAGETWDFYLSVSSRNAHRFVRMEADEHVVRTLLMRVRLFRTSRGNLSAAEWTGRDRFGTAIRTVAPRSARWSTNARTRLRG